jgi:hypothetical protein
MTSRHQVTPEEPHPCSIVAARPGPRELRFAGLRDSLGRVMASLVVGGVFLLAMIVASVRAAVVLPAGARIPLHVGSVEHCYLAPKRAGLVVWPAVGAVAFGVLGGIAASRLAVGWVPGVRYVVVPAALCVVFGFQVGALVLARETTGRSD